MPSKKDKTVSKKAISDLFQGTREEIKPPQKTSPIVMILISILAGFVAGTLSFALFLSGGFEGVPWLDSQGLVALLPEQQVIVRQQQSVTVTELVQLKDLSERLSPHIITFVETAPKRDDLEAYHNADTLGFGFVLSADGWVVTHSDTLKGLDISSLVALSSQGQEFTLVQIVPDDLTGVSFVKLNAQDLSAANIEPLVDHARGTGLVAASLSLPSGQTRLTRLSQHGFTEGALAQDSETVTRELLIKPAPASGLSEPVFDLSGQLVGMAHLTDSIWRLLPSDYFRGLINSVLGAGEIRRADLGLTWVGLEGNFGLSSEIRQDFHKGAYVVSVEEGSAASSAGLEAGDVILRINDFELNGGRNLSELVMGAKPEDIFIISAVRDGEEFEFVATLKELK